MIRYGEIYAIHFLDGVYVGSAIGFSFRRWREHLRLLRKGTHHCHTFQRAFTRGGVASLSFSILEDGVPSGDLATREYEWSVRLRSSNALPVQIVKRHLRAQVLADVLKCVPYRTIAKSHGVSLGFISNAKSQMGELIATPNTGP